MYVNSIALLHIIVLIIILVYKVSMRICIYLLSFFFTRQQSVHCFKFTVIASTISMFLFLLGLDVFYEHTLHAHACIYHYSQFSIFLI